MLVSNKVYQLEIYPSYKGAWESVAILAESK